MMPSNLPEAPVSSGSCRDLLPRILRSREWRLYDQNSRRFLDLWQAGGTAVLGHRPEGLSNEVKNVLARGLWADFPSVYTGRLRKHVAALLPAHPEIRVFPHRDRALSFARTVLGIRGFADPALGEEAADGAALWRPFCPEVPSLRVCLPILPFPGEQAPVCLAFRKGEAPEEGEVSAFSGGTGGSPVLLAGVTRAAVLLLRRLAEGENPRWTALELSGWNRRGPYLSRSGGPEGEAYREFFRRGLEKGLLLPPDPSQPLILPGEMSDGELAAVRSFLSE